MNSGVSLPVVIIGAGPAGLMAAECLARQGWPVRVFDAMPSAGRKFLLAGIGGMNITHSEDLLAFIARYDDAAVPIGKWLQRFSPQQLRDWIHGLGIETFVGSSGRVFPKDMKAAPLLRAWLQRLRELGVQFQPRSRWLGWAESPAGGGQRLRIQTPDGEQHVDCAALVLALGGGSWPKLGSDGGWLPLLQQQGVDVAPLKPANCGFDIGWSPLFAEKFAGEALKPVVLDFVDSRGRHWQRQGEAMITATGIEGGLIYAVSAALRDAIDATGHATLRLDLVPGRDYARLLTELNKPRGSKSLAAHLQRAGIGGVRVGLLREVLSKDRMNDMAQIAKTLKALPLTLNAARPLAEVISSAGGVRFAALTDTLMLKRRPGVFCAGEMIDWEAPTGGYLLTACFASGCVAADGVQQWLAQSG
ncbi:TIGR03862 family flavoprotein [Permianibacter sp. IMCC34836]|uniref:TIGR03862 family flavoprotein n=1 Tax=Permianibacter fluminis TaxID=2738515 RepID=UPI00155288D4|nr:TIGR03862 family flavoprotein [Permianibacter fluminis]NQD35964.1 TIGR03862 family flavoprotein [Permianibacter fluminis]